MPFHRLKDVPQEEVAIVDAIHPQILTFSHWKGANTHQSIQADTSAEICVNAVLKDFKGWNSPYISANHFDIDGFVGVMALLLADTVKAQPKLFIEMGEIGDFRHFKPNDAISHEALKLCIWLNEMEKELFYVPFGQKNEIEACVQKFHYFIQEFPKVLGDIAAQSFVWEKAYQEVLEGLDQIISRTDIPDLRLQIVRSHKVVPYYALFSGTEQCDLVMSLYEHNRYELEYKYTSWVDIVSQATFPRIDLRPLAKQLNGIEKSEFSWHADRITDTGPILRLEKEKISKADRFANPTEREIYSSSIDESEFVEICTHYLSQKLKDLSRKRFWTWEAMKSINSAS